jgi:phage gpG-like protein
MARPAFGVEITGLDELLRDLKRFGIEAADMKDVFGAISKEARTVMVGFIGSRSGALARSFRPSRAKNKAVVRGGGKKVPYAGAVQWGWGRGNSEYIDGRYATGIRGSFAGQDFFSRTDVVMGPRAERMLFEGIEDLIQKHDLD